MIKILNLYNYKDLYGNTMKLLKPPEVSPKELFYLIQDLYSKTRLFYLLKSTMDLGIFEHLEEFKTTKELAKEIGMDEILLESTLEALSDMMGLLDKKLENGNAYYKNSKVAQLYLKKDSEYSYLLPIGDLFKNLEYWRDFGSILKNKKIVDERDFFSEVVKVMADECKCWELQKTIEYLLKFEEFRKAKKLLDVGGGHGLYSIGFTMTNKNLKCYVFDLPKVTKDTENYIRRYNAKNVFTIEGDFYKDDIGGDYDIVFSSYNPGGRDPLIIEKIYNALREGGLYINKQCFPSCEDVEDILDNMEWNFFEFKNYKKEKLRYSFERSLQFQDYIRFLKDMGFEILDIVNLKDILGYEMVKNTRIIVARKLEGKNERRI